MLRSKRVTSDRSGKALIEFRKEEVEQSIPERFEKMAHTYPDRTAVKTKDLSLLLGATLLPFDVKQEGILIRLISSPLYRELCSTLTGSERFPDLRYVRLRVMYYISRTLIFIGNTSLLRARWRPVSPREGRAFVEFKDKKIEQSTLLALSIRHANALKALPRRAGTMTAPGGHEISSRS